MSWVAVELESRRWASKHRAGVFAELNVVLVHQLGEQFIREGQQRTGLVYGDGRALESLPSGWPSIQIDRYARLRRFKQERCRYPRSHRNLLGRTVSTID